MVVLPALSGPAWTTTWRLRSGPRFARCSRQSRSRCLSDCNGVANLGPAEIPR
jgi:hypothetical protein